MVSGPNTTVALRGYERLASLSDGESTKVVHAMLVRCEGPDGLDLLRQHLLPAVAMTFNKHPRMRALQVRGQFAKAEIQPAISAADVDARKLLRLRAVRDGGVDPADQYDDDAWQQFVESECEIGFDRFTQFPFYLVVWTDRERATARLMLFSDHYMSDGYSGMVVLHDVLTFVARLSQTEMQDLNSAIETASSSPLRPSIYEIWRDESPVRTALSKLAIKLAGRAIFRHIINSFHAKLPARDDQRDFSGMPPPCNSTRGLFARGETAKFGLIVARCRQERVTLGGALVAAIVAAHAHLLSQREPSGAAAASPFKLSLDMDYNMRKRLPVSDGTTNGNGELTEVVGMYVAIATLEELATKGVDVDKTRFWDFARVSKRQIDDTLKHSWGMQIDTLALDVIQHMTKGSIVRQCLQADVNVSNIGRYPFPETHELTGSGDARTQLTVESLHVYNSIPTLSPGGCVLITCAGGALNYAIAHKYEDDLARALFDRIVAFCEGLGNISETDTIADATKALL